jgi:alpha-glucuronidase
MLFAFALPTPAESGHKAWLRYAAIDNPRLKHGYDSLPAAVVALDNSGVVKAAQGELIRGVSDMLCRTLRSETALPNEDAILLGTLDSVKKAEPAFDAPTDLRTDGFCLKTVTANGHKYLVITAVNERGVLYGTFALLRKMGLQESLAGLNEMDNPYAPLRMVNQWDNLDGTIERGYGGKSIFFEDNNVVTNLNRVHDYGRLLASVGINGCCVNNVNANARVISTDFLPQLARLADAFRPWGVKLFVSIDFSSPEKIGGLDTFDPLNPQVINFWNKKVEEIYAAIPDFGGFVLKADSEGRLGPSAYHRTPVDAANVIARALKPHGGILFYRAFVYNSHLDWRNLKNDRARAAYDIFHPLDGQFDDNVVVQIKNGPIDFQVREPASPLFAGLKKTSEAIEVQITQEYTGQQRHLCFLVPMWKTTLDFDMHAKGANTLVKALVGGKIFGQPTGGFVGVADVGRDPNWLGSDLAQANLYGFGRLAWNPDLSSKQIIEEWTRLTFGNNPKVVKTISDMQLKSWRAYEDYTGPLGAGTLTDILGSHYGPNIESCERNGWGQWIRADTNGIGMDRTIATGTGYIGQYPPAVAQMYESLKTCPDNLLLFFHHEPYNYVLHSGKTVIQHIYDTHYEGVAETRNYVCEWKSLKGLVDEHRYHAVLAKLKYQVSHATVWRDAICQWFLKESGIPDKLGRAGHYPNRIEAENMTLDGYKVFEVNPWENASGGKAVECVSPDRHGSVSFRYDGKAGWHNLAVQYFDQDNGVSQFKLYVDH